MNYIIVKTHSQHNSFKDPRQHLLFLKKNNPKVDFHMKWNVLPYQIENDILKKQNAFREKKFANQKLKLNELQSKRFELSIKPLLYANISLNLHLTRPFSEHFISFIGRGK